MCLPPFSLTQPIILKHSTIERGFQKPPFCVAKVWFLACKKWVFALQKYGFCFLREYFLFCNTPYRVHETPTKWRCVFPSLILQYIIPYPRNTHQMALRYIVPRPRTPTKWHCVGAIWQYNIYLFLGIVHLFISY